MRELSPPLSDNVSVCVCVMLIDGYKHTHTPLCSETSIRNNLACIQPFP